MNTAIRLADPHGATLVILDNYLGWYCDVTNIFIRQKHIQSEIIIIKIEELLNFVVKIKL